MLSFPNCKINLGLRIVRKRTDGYHDLETVFYPLPFCDALEIIPSRQLPFSFTASGIIVDASTENNLCVKAYQLLKKDFPALPPAQIHLHKAIPTGGGLGGGSADAAFTLQLLNNEFKLGITDHQLSTYALQLGSDCPFFLINKPCYATGRGEELTTIELDLSAYDIMLVYPGIPVSTTQAFAGITPAMPSRNIKEIIHQPVDTWKAGLINDFEPVVFKMHPAIGSIKEELYRQDAVYASLSGSGSTVYGIFAKENKPVFSFPPHYIIKSLAG